jgi:N-acetylglucosamine kinase-like BadF-type ATPase
MDYFLGVDAGNSKTVALVAQTDGTILGCGRGAGGDIYVSETGATAAVAEAVTQA